MAEVWKPVVGFEGRYEVSSLGRVRSVDMLVTAGKRQWHQKGRTLKPGKADKTGHLAVCLTGKNSCYVHNLVATAFIGQRPSPKHECLHKNDKPDDNRLINLRWATRSDNLRDRKWNKGAANYKLNPDAVRNIRELVAAGDSQRTVARLLGLHRNTIGQVMRGLTHVDV